MTPAILTIAKIIVIWTLASIPLALIVARLIGANERAGSGKPEPLRRGDEVDFIQHGERQ